MATNKMIVQINMEPSSETLAASLMMLELWINAYEGRNILAERRITEEGERIYLSLKRSPEEIADESQTKV